MNLDHRIKEVEQFVVEQMPRQHFDSFSFGLIDFSNANYKSFCLQRGDLSFNREFPLYFDLASLTKPLTLALAFLIDQNLWDKKKLAWLLNHRASMPSWIRLSKHNWQEVVDSFIPVVSEIDLYSDISALRLQREIENLTQKSLYEMVANDWHDGVLWWGDNKLKNHHCVESGWRNGQRIIREVHDDNAYLINKRLSHAGLFSDIDSLCQTLIAIDQKRDFLKFMKECFQAGEVDGRRFIRGWDHPTSKLNSLAGQGFSPYTFGHLGFTGTSVWIDAQKKLGHVILSNATQNYWYDKNGLNEMRKKIGTYIWSEKWI